MKKILAVICLLPFLLVSCHGYKALATSETTSSLTPGKHYRITLKDDRKRDLKFLEIAGQELKCENSLHVSERIRLDEIKKIEQRRLNIPATTAVVAGSLCVIVLIGKYAPVSIGPFF